MFKLFKEVLGHMKVRKQDGVRKRPNEQMFPLTKYVLNQGRAQI